MGKAQSWLKPRKLDEKIIPLNTINDNRKKNKKANTLIITVFCFE